MSAPTDNSRVGDGGPAFPGSSALSPKGMSLRDWFAGQALAGMLACPTMSDGLDNAAYARLSFGLADAMLAEQKKGGAA